MSTLSGFILPYEPDNNLERTATVQKYWVQAGLQAAKKNATRVLFEENGVTGLVSLGKEFSRKTENERNESYKQAVASGLNKLLEVSVQDIAVEVGAYPHAAGAPIVH
jgi:hypothetical protein